MASQTILEQKKAKVAAIKSDIDASVAGVIVDYKGITVADDTALRKEMREAGVKYEVVKNTLLRKAIEGTSLEGLSSILEGTTALAASTDDRVAPAKILGKFASTHKNFNLKGGYLDGEVLSLEKLDELSKLPSREVLLSMVLGAFQAPIAAFARAVQAVADKKAEGGEEPAPAAEAEAPAAEAEAPAAEAEAPAAEAEAPAAEAEAPAAE
ncbi:MAG: 50S ribosomal protein L10 [Clostridiales bacterium]|nr:50S ribosomal protein L10 [Clostridiales bacterium]